MAEPPLIQWVECSRCEKWRIIHPLPDGSEEVIPDIWFCEMNRDPAHNTCEAPEEEYKVPEMPIIPLLPVLPPNTNRLPRPAKSNDPDSIRAKLKQLTNEDLQAAFESIDIERVLNDEFGTFRSLVFDPTVEPIPVAPKSNQKSTKAATKKEIDFNALVTETQRILTQVSDILPAEITASLRP